MPHDVPDDAELLTAEPAPVSRLRKFLVILLVALLCLAFAGLIWALAL